SMGLVDAVDGSGNVSRWAASRGEGVSAGQIKSVDSAAASLLAAKRQLEVFAKMPDSTKDGTAARALLAEGIEAVRGGAALVKSSVTQLDGAQTELGRKLSEATAGIESELLKVLETKSGEFKRGKSLAALDRKTWLPRELDHLAAAAAQVQQVADEVAKSAEAGAAGVSRGNVADPSKRSRLDKVEDFMKAADEGWLKELAKSANVTRYEFGEKVVPSSPAGAAGGDSQVGKRTLAPATQLDAALQQIAFDNTAHPLAA